MRRREFFTLVGGVAASPLVEQAQLPRILYFTHSAGYRHEVIPLSKTILTQLGKVSGAFEVAATEDTSEITTENLRRYAALVFYTTGELPMSGGEKSALLEFVRSGRGFLGIHSAADTFYSWPDYLDLVLLGFLPYFYSLYIIGVLGLYTIFEGVVGVFSFWSMIGGIFWLFVGFHLIYRFYLMTEIVRQHDEKTALANSTVRQSDMS
jgi:hypothetical protein